MIDGEKVLTWLEICGKNRDCSDCCPYGRASEELCRENLMTDAFALLKEQEPRVMKLGELADIYVEFKDNACPIRLSFCDLQKIIMHMVDGDCRLWTGKPTDEQRKAVKWE